MTKVISERNLDNRTIKKTKDGTKIQVQVSSDDTNMLKVTENGLEVRKPNTIKLTSLGGVEIGEVIVE